VSPRRIRTIGVATACGGRLSAASLAGALRRRFASYAVTPLAALPEPGTLAATGAGTRSGADALVLVLPRDHPRARDLRRSAPIEPPVRVVLVAGDGDDVEAARAVSEVTGWVAALRERPALEPHQLRPRLRPAGSALGRRDLLAPLAATHELLPAVTAEVCVGIERCGLCATRCPAGAVSPRDGRAAIDGRRCTGCGVCAGACPVDAVRWPGATKEEIDACLRGMLGSRREAGAPALVAFTCAGSDGAFEAPWLECVLPCVALASPWAILRALSLGASAVALVARDTPCRERHAAAGLDRTVLAARLILDALGLDADRVAALETPPAPDEFAAAAGALGRSLTLDGRRPPFTLGALAAAMAEVWRRPTRAVRSPELPFARAAIDTRRCSLCGLCALCPTGAVARAEHADDVRLLFRYAGCTGCGLCEKICPEKALQLTPVLDPARLGEGPRVLAAGALVRCKRCAEPIAPAAMLEAIERRMAARRGPTLVLGTAARLCVACRLS
jgi:ferredoxin